MSSDGGVPGAFPPHLGPCCSIARSAGIGGCPAIAAIRVGVAAQQPLDAVAELVGDLHQRAALVDQQ